MVAALYPNTSTYTYTYDAADEKTGECGGTRCYTFVYDDNAALRVTIYPNQSFVWNILNNAGLVTNEDIRRCPTSLCNFATGNGATPPSDLTGAVDYTYAYDHDGRLTSKQRYAVTTTPQTATATYGYDNVGRLSTSTDLGGNQSAFTYDPDSNRLSEIDTPSGGTAATTTYTYDATVTAGLDQLTKTQLGTNTPTCYRYTPEGNESKYGDNATCDNTLTIAWDNRNRPKTGQWLKADNPPFGASHLASLFWHYDALGRLISECTAACLGANLGFGEPGSPVLANAGLLIKDADGTGTLSKYPGANADISFDYYDTHGDIAATSSTSATPASFTVGTANTFTAFGAVQPVPGVSYGLNNAWLAGSDIYFQKGINLYPMGARMYDPAIGRFISPDPVDGGSANPYDYVNQDPVNKSDVDGTLDGPDIGDKIPCFLFTCPHESQAPAHLRGMVSAVTNSAVERIAYGTAGCYIGVNEFEGRLGAAKAIKFAFRRTFKTAFSWATLLYCGIGAASAQVAPNIGYPPS